MTRALAGFVSPVIDSNRPPQMRFATLPSKAGNCSGDCGGFAVGAAAGF